MAYQYVSKSSSTTAIDQQILRDVTGSDPTFKERLTQILAPLDASNDWRPRRMRSCSTRHEPHVQPASASKGKTNLCLEG